MTDTTGRDAESLAMIAGDMLHAFAIRSCVEACSFFPRGTEALHRILNTSVITASGQCDELLLTRADPGQITEEKLLRLYDTKSGMYSFQTPLVVGALLAAAPETTILDLEESGKDLGRAYQILDDLDDLLSRNGTAPLLEDIGNGMITLPLLRLYHRCNDETVRAGIRRARKNEGFLRGDFQECLHDWMETTGTAESIISDCSALYTKAAEKLFRNLSTVQSRNCMKTILSRLFSVLETPSDLSADASEGINGV